jgi:hypothetical protein
VTAIPWVRNAAALGLVVLSGAWFDGVARAQIAYQPIVSPILDGVALSATPVVSPDRLYVRMTLNPYFNTVNGFTTYSAPIGAVGGGNFAGAGGVIGGPGVAGTMAPTAAYIATGTYRAGDYSPPVAGGFGAANDPFDQGGVIPMRTAAANQGPAVPALAGGPEIADPLALANAPPEPSVRARKKAAAARRQASRKASRRSANATSSPR